MGSTSVDPRVGFAAGIGFVRSLETAVGLLGQGRSRVQGTGRWVSVMTIVFGDTIFCSEFGLCRNRCDAVGNL